jgi:eukaryotic-like serine/threonine-protein kinase
MPDDSQELMRWYRLEALWDDARRLSAADRRVFLDREAGDDPLLRAELEQLLARSGEAEDLLERFQPVLGRSAAAALDRLLFEEIAVAVEGRYIVEQLLARVGSAAVFAGRDTADGRPIAIKVLEPGVAAGVGWRRFEREIRLAAELQHTGILPMLDYGRIPATEESARRLFYVMPLVPDGSLRRRLDESGCIPVETALNIVAGVAAALDHAHGRGIVHRDVKPENILLEGDRALLADFGVARAMKDYEHSRLTDLGGTPGTRSYMSPEQAKGGADLDGRSDLFSLACVFCEAVTGRIPRMQEDAPAMRHLADALPGFESVLVRALARRAEDRYATGSELVDALTAAFNGVFPVLGGED